MLFVANKGLVRDPEPKNVMSSCWWLLLGGVVDPKSTLLETKIASENGWLED